MYTQCPDCGTVFKVTADALRAAQGSVRCGICSTRFSALEYLSEEPLLRPHEEDVSPEDTITVEEMPGTEFIELPSSREPAAGSATPSGGPDETTDRPQAGEDLGGEAPPRGDDTDAAGDGGAGAEDGGDADASSDADIALEFRGSAEDLEKLFVEQAMKDFFAPGAAGVEDLEKSIGEIADTDLSGIEVVEESLPEGTAHGGESARPGRSAAVLAFRPPGRNGTDHGEQAAAEARAAASKADEDDAISDALSRTDEYPVLVLDEMTDGGPIEGGEPLQILIPEELRRGADDPTPTADVFAAGNENERPGGRRWPLGLAVLVLLVVLAAQATHFWRDDLVRNPILGPSLLRAYTWAGLRLDPPVDLSAFELRQLGAANDPAQSGRLKVRASIVNHAPFAQPYPLLRLSLQDRFGTTVGVRDLEPAEYLPGGGAGALLAPSLRADAEIVFVDPGRDAVGYELDVCLRDTGGVRCSAQLTGRRP